ncbi:hypothetical protein BC628DRAFT_760795 [Trametes gibbosa]|nr:hypothetical protein BC628DRAFT_760795 [Trametes gibbosa]
MRQRQVSAGGLPAPAGGMSKQGQISPQRYNAILGQQHMPGSSPVGGYESLQSTSSIVDNELTVALRGMAVEEEYGSSPQNAPYRQGSGGAPPSGLPGVRGPQQPLRGPYGGYAQTEYAAYYTGPSYAYDAYRTAADASMYATSPALTPATAAPNQFYDYAGSPRPIGSQYFYPTQAIVYHAPPSHSPMLATHPLAGMPDKRQDQVRVLLLSQ